VGVLDQHRPAPAAEAFVEAGGIGHVEVHAAQPQRTAQPVELGLALQFADRTTLCVEFTQRATGLRLEAQRCFASAAQLQRAVRLARPMAQIVVVLRAARTGLTLA
jgi:hypothetical protein